MGGGVEGEAAGREFVGKHVAAVSDVGADFEERAHLADEVQMIADHGAAVAVLFGVMGDGALRLAEGGEVVELYFGAFYGKRLGGQAFVVRRSSFVVRDAGRF